MKRIYKRLVSLNVFPILSLGLFFMIITLTVFQVRQTQSTQSSAATGLTNCSIDESLMPEDNEEYSLSVDINDFRVKNNLPSLGTTGSLTRAAIWHSTDMAQRNTLDHTDSTGRDPMTRVSDCGFSPIKAFGENLAKGQTKGDDVFEGWKNSPGHLANLLCEKCTHMGVARVRANNGDWYWTLDVGSLKDTTKPTKTPSAAPSPTGNKLTPTVPISSPTPSTKPKATPTPEVTLPPAKKELPEGTTGMYAYVYIPGTYYSASNEVKHPNRPLTVTIATSEAEEIAKVEGVVSFDEEWGYFTGAIAFPSTLETGDYLIKVKTDHSLTQLVNKGYVKITKGEVVDPDYVTLPNADLDDDNKLSFNDIREFRTCITTETCWADLNDDGNMNLLDYNAFLEAFEEIEGD